MTYFLAALILMVPVAVVVFILLNPMDPNPPKGKMPDPYVSNLHRPIQSEHLAREEVEWHIERMYLGAEADLVAVNKLFELANIERDKAGLPRFELDHTLARSAQAKADHMEEHGYYSHDCPDGTGPAEFAYKAGATGFRAECINRCRPIMPYVMHVWMESAGHRRIFLMPELTKVGFGVRDHGRYLYTVAHFG